MQEERGYGYMKLSLPARGFMVDRSSIQAEYQELQANDKSKPCRGKKPEKRGTLPLFFDALMQ
jgi:hypothetical protein